MSDTFPSLVWPGRTRYHAVYGSHDGGYDPHNARWQYWVECSGGPKTKDGFPRPSPRVALVSIDTAERFGLRPCSSCSKTLSRIDALDGGQE